MSQHTVPWRSGGQPWDVAAPTLLLPASDRSRPGGHRRRVLAQAARFLLVGGIATVVDIGLFNLLHYDLLDVGLVIGPITAKVTSTLVAGVVAFVGNRQWSFGAERGPGRLQAQVLAFVLVNAAALLLALLPLAVARYVLGLTGVLALNLAGNVLGLFLATALRFWGYRRWVFPDPVEQPADRHVAAAREDAAA